MGSMTDEALSPDRSTNEKTPRMVGHSVEHIPVGTVVFVKASGNNVVRGEIRAVSIIIEVKEKVVTTTVKYDVEGYSYYADQSKVFLSAESAFS